jgi:hypothetical protein
LGWNQQPKQSIRWHFARNRSGEVIPPFACCALGPVDSATSGNDSLKDTVVKQEESDDDEEMRLLDLYKPGDLHAFWPDAAMIVFNDQYPIQPDQKERVTNDFPCFALIRDATGKPSDDLSPVSGAWHLEKSQRGAFRLVGQDPMLDYSATTPVPYGVGWIEPANRQRVDATDMIILRNSSADARRAGDILELGSLLSPTLDPLRPWLDGVTPTVHPRQVAVLLAAASKYTSSAPSLSATATDPSSVPCIMAGVVQAYVNVTDTKHRRAYPVKDGYVLQSGFCGPAELIYKPASTGEQKCLVRLSTPNAVQLLVLCPATGIPAATYTKTGSTLASVTPGSATCAVWEWDVDQGKDVPMLNGSSPVTVTVKNNAPTAVSGVTNGGLIHVLSDDDYQFRTIVEYCTNGFK